MSEATGGNGGRAEIKRRLIERSLEDEAFRQQLLDDPKAAIEQELGTLMTAEVEILAVEETADTIYLVLPPATSLVGPDGEIPDRELEAVAGGYTKSHSDIGSVCFNDPTFPGCPIAGRILYVGYTILRPHRPVVGLRWVCKPPHVLDVVSASVAGVSLLPPPTRRF